MYTITYQRPYTGQTMTQSFQSLAEAQSMIDFYASCGTRACLVDDLEAPAATVSFNLS